MIKQGHNHLIRLDYILIAIILIIAFGFRMYKINTPLADFHSWRQADTAAVSRNFVRDGIDLMHPKYDDLSNIQSGIENPKGYRFVEFPIYNALIAIMYKVMPIFPIEVWGRIISILSSLVVLAIIYYFLAREYSRFAAVVGAIVFAVFPFFVFFSRVVLPEMNGLAFAFLSMFLAYLYMEGRIKKLELVYFAASILCFICALLIKPTLIFYALPILYLFVKNYGSKLYSKPQFYIFFLLGVLPLILWRKYILSFPEGIPASGWLITSVNTGGGLQRVFLRPSFFRWIFYERINNIILGGYGTFLFVLGFMVKAPRWFIHSIIGAALAYLFVFEGGNVQHAYYQTLILPAIAMSIGLAAGFLYDHAGLFISRFSVFFLIFLTLAFGFFISYNQVKDYYAIPQDLVNIARYIDLATTPDDKIVTDTLGDTTLLYLADRKGAPAVFKGLSELKAKGYTYFVTLNKDVTKDIIKTTDYRIVQENEKFTLFKL